VGEEMRDEEIRQIREHNRRVHICLGCKWNNACHFQVSFVNGEVCAIKEEEIKNGKR